MQTEKLKRLIVERLEDRVLLSGLWQGVDVDGDRVTIRLRGPGEFTVFSIDEGFGELIERIELDGTGPTSKLTINARRSGGIGDGYVDIGEIDAEFEVLRQIQVDGNIGNLYVGAVDKVTAFSAATLDGSEGEWFLDDDVKQIRLKGDMDLMYIEIDGSLKKVTINGSMSAATLFVDGQLKNLRVKGDVEEDSIVHAEDTIGQIRIDGFLDRSTIETKGDQKKLYVGEDILDSVVFAEYSMKNIVVQGSIIGSVIESRDTIHRMRLGWDIVDSVIQADWAIGTIIADGGMVNSIIESGGYIRRVDVWDWITHSDIIAGPEGIGTIFAYDISDTTIDSLGEVRHLILDVENEVVVVEEHVIIIDDGLWYWPIDD